MPRALALALLGSCLLSPAQAQTGQATYAAYAAGLNVLNIQASFAVAPDRYRVQVVYRTAGAFGVVVRSNHDTTAEGRFVQDRAAPSRFYSYGTLRGEQRITQIDYPSGQPSIRQLVPPNEKEREPVPPAQQANTIDTLSAMAQLLRQVNATGRCEGRVMTFDGRRLSEMVARTTGTQVLEQTSRSSFAGPALRCDFEGRQLGGFMLDEDRERLRRPHRGTAWFASLTPDGPKVPVRMVFETRFFGQATMYIHNPQ